MCTVLELLCVLFSVLALNFPFNTRCSNEQLKNVLLLFGFQDKCPRICVVQDICPITVQMKVSP